MEFEYRYRRSSSASSGADATEMSFQPDTRRNPTFFRGQLARKIEFREAISALHQVVVSDLRWKPKDRTAYFAWLATQEEVDWQAAAAQEQQTAAELAAITAELRELRARHAGRMRGFHAARQRYFDYLYQKDRDAWFVLDPVITVHPDEVFFECFSQDESSYGRLAASHEVFTEVGEMAFGTTNIDYSQALYDEFQKIRSYKNTQLEIDPSGFEVQTSHEESFKEVKIDLPDSWVRGFLQVSSAMSLDAVTLTLHPMDVHNLCHVLRRNKELHGPRGMRYVLEPGAPVRVVFEPWNLEVPCPRSPYHGTEAREIRVWGRRRIHILERLIPLARAFTVHLLGTGMPSFYVADLGAMTFTLGLSGWTANDWSASGNFDLMAPRADVDELTQRRVFTALQETWVESADSLSGRLGLDRAQVLGALGGYVQAGRAIFDLHKGVYRIRELSRDPLPMASLRFASKREEHAVRLVDAGGVSVSARRTDDRLVIDAVVRDGNKQLAPMIVLDGDERMVEATCTCNFFSTNRLYKGPCPHMLAARLAFARRRDQLEAAIAAGAPVAKPFEAPAPEPAPDTDEGSATRPAGMWRRFADKLTGRRRAHDDDIAERTRLAAMAIERAIRELVDEGLLKIERGHRADLVDEMLAAVERAQSASDATQRALVALLASEHPEEIYGDDETILEVIQRAFEAVQRAAGGHD